MAEPIHRNSLKPGYKVHWYRIGKVLGQGGFGITYLAHDFNLDHKVAIKEYLPIDLAVRERDLVVQPAAEAHRKRFQWGLDRFMTEAQTLTRFKHPNIVRVLAVFEANRTGYMVMEYEEGDSLKGILTTHRTLKEDKLSNIVLPILGGLEKVHERGFIHRDIKPANIFIREDGSPVLIDFGSARQALGAEIRPLTILVSPGYAPIEQYYSKGEEQGPWTDIYGLGATLYHAVTGQRPQDALQRSQALHEAARDSLVGAGEIGKGRYSAPFLKAIDHALEFRQKDRPQTVAEWRREFGPTPHTRAKVKAEDKAMMGTTIPADEPPGGPRTQPGPLTAPARRTGLISHKYEVQDQLGQGSMGVVYKVRHIALETISALKVLPTHLMGNPELVKRFYREARVMARLHHPNIARVIDIQRDDDLQFYYFVMEYIQGQTLRQYLQERGALPLRDVIEITRQVARALDSAHRHNPPVIHRDIKPTNIMIEDGSQRVVVMDFGIAKELDESEMTKAGTMLGTLKYCPPEQMRHAPLDGSADVYALGMVMYEAYTGTHLLAGLGEEEVIRKVLDPQEHELFFRSGTPAEFVALVTRAVAKAREKRYRRMADLLGDIDTLWSTLDETKSVILPVAAVVESGPGGGHDDLTVFEEQTHKLEEERERRRVLLLEAQVRESKQKAAREGQTVVEARKRMEEVRVAAEQVGARGRFAEAFAAAEQKNEQGRRSEEGEEFAAATGWYEKAAHLTTLRPASPRYTPPPRPRPLAEPKPRRAPILASLAVVSLIAAGLALYLQRPASEPPPKPTPAPALPTPAPTPSPVAPLPQSPVTPVTPTPELAPTDDIASLEVAAKSGEADAVVALVLRYWDRNQPGDAEKAVAILKRSDDPRALHLLGQCYANGRGIQRDVEQAFNLFGRAARLGDLDAKHDLAVMIMNPPSGVEANPRYAASLFKEGAQAGNVNCMHSYARGLWEGAGIRKDQDEALKWFRKAAAQGHQGAARWLAEHQSARDQD